MKKIFIYLLLIIGICFIIPIFFTSKFKTEEVAVEPEEEQTEISIEEYSYTDFDTIRLLHSKTGEIEEINLDDYIVDVTSAEIPVDYEIEAIKAQSVAARTYTIYKILHGSKHENADLCDDSACCQAWISKEDRMARWEQEKQIDNWNKIVEAVNATLGEVVTYEKQVINAFFHSNSGGTTETASAVWGGQNYPYLQAVETSGEEAYQQYSSEVILSKEELLNKLKTKYNDIEIDFNNEESIKILDYTEGKRVKTVRFGNKEIARSGSKNYLRTKICEFYYYKDK